MIMHDSDSNYKKLNIFDLEMKLKNSIDIRMMNIINDEVIWMQNIKNERGYYEITGGRMIEKV